MAERLAGPAVRGEAVRKEIAVPAPGVDPSHPANSQRVSGNAQVRMSLQLGLHGQAGDCGIAAVGSIGPLRCARVLPPWPYGPAPRPDKATQYRVRGHQRLGASSGQRLRPSPNQGGTSAEWPLPASFSEEVSGPPRGSAIPTALSRAREHGVRRRDAKVSPLFPGSSSWGNMPGLVSRLQTCKLTGD
ncbi:hypothetical protein SKAU_G00143350 [Synaphobranchus kaupii]|uniref:Uncharacterized protein n=1 Tax=Synaphobranchus kaupii TaxID=118154 RepID=A0A9Q1FT46_SYNKA|nr:hypothetical protein SKAU_G00143350 [Synaphobranchus kaupii]